MEDADGSAETVSVAHQAVPVQIISIASSSGAPSAASAACSPATSSASVGVEGDCGGTPTTPLLGPSSPAVPAEGAGGAGEGALRGAAVLREDSGRECSVYVGDSSVMQSLLLGDCLEPLRKVEGPLVAEPGVVAAEVKAEAEGGGHQAAEGGAPASAPALLDPPRPPPPPPPPPPAEPASGSAPGGEAAGAEEQEQAEDAQEEEEEEAREAEGDERLQAPTSPPGPIDGEEWDMDRDQEAFAEYQQHAALDDWGEQRRAQEEEVEPLDRFVPDRYEAGSPRLTPDTPPIPGTGPAASSSSASPRPLYPTPPPPPPGGPPPVGSYRPPPGLEQMMAPPPPLLAKPPPPERPQAPPAPAPFSAPLVRNALAWVRLGCNGGHYTLVFNSEQMDSDSFLSHASDLLSTMCSGAGVVEEDFGGSDAQAINSIPGWQNAIARRSFCTMGELSGTCAVGCGPNKTKRSRACKLAVVICILAENLHVRGFEAQVDLPVVRRLAEEARALKDTLRQQPAAASPGGTGARLRRPPTPPLPAHHPAPPPAPATASRALPPPPPLPQQAPAFPPSPPPADAPSAASSQALALVPVRVKQMRGFIDWPRECEDQPGVEIKAFTSGGLWPWCTLCSCWSDLSHIQSKKHTRNVEWEWSKGAIQAAPTTPSPNGSYAPSVASYVAPPVVTSPAALTWHLPPAPSAAASAPVQRQPPPLPSLRDMYEWQRNFADMMYDWSTIEWPEAETPREFKHMAEQLEEAEV